MKYLTVIFFLFFSFSIVSAQQDWTLLQQVNGITFYTKSEACQQAGLPQPLLYRFIKVENAGSQTARVFFNLHTFYSSHCDGCNNSPESERSFDILPGQVIYGDCNFSNSVKLDLLEQSPFLSELIFSHIELANLSVSWIN
jgi:hypothetical protein